MKYPNINVGIIGGGFGYYGHFKALKRFKNVKIKAISTKKKILISKNIKKYNSAFDLILNEKLDLITVATTPKLQQQLIPHLTKKCNMFLEKPLGISFNKLKKIRFSKKKIGINFTFPEIEEFKYFRDTVKKQKFQKVYINWKFFSKFSKNSKWKNNSKYGGGIIFNYFSHVLYYINFLFGKIKKIEKIKKKKYLLDCRILTKDKKEIIFNLNSRYEGEPTHEIKIYTHKEEYTLKTKDPLRFSNFNIFKNKKKLKIIKNKKVARYDNRYIYVAKILKRFIHSIQKNKPFSPNVKDGLENLKWLNKIEKV